MNLEKHLREIPNWPKEGVLFKDISPLLLNPQCFGFIIDELKKRYSKVSFDKIIGIDARGFIFASALAYALQKPLLLARKKGKLPPPTVTESYSLEYGEATLELSSLAIKEGDKVLLIDDLIATGGSAGAANSLVKKAGGKIMEAAFIMDIRKSIGSQFELDCPIFSLI